MADLHSLSNADLIKAIKLLKKLSDTNPIAFMSLKLYNEELNKRCCVVDDHE